jgi:hypothetical protein
MRNLKVYNKETFEFYKDSIKRKRNPKDDLTYKDRLSDFEEEVSERYILYDEKYELNSLQDIDPETFSSQVSSDLLSLYKFSSKMMVDLKVKLTTTKNNSVSNDCQNCTIGEINSFDHYLPKELFPEFAINPKNLIPSCTKCNSFKGVNWKDKSRRLFLNPYLDKLPEKEFLFVDIKVDRNNLDIDFKIDNRNKLAADLFDIIESHYSRLYLCSRFSENCEKIIIETKTEILKYSTKLPFKEIKQTIIECAEENRKFFGFNHYNYILQIALVNNDAFIKEYVGVKSTESPVQN